MNLYLLVVGIMIQYVQDKNVIKILNVIVIKVNIVNGILLNQNMNVYQVKQNVLNVKLGVNIVNK